VLNFVVPDVDEAGVCACASAVRINLVAASVVVPSRMARRFSGERFRAYDLLLRAMPYFTVNVKILVRTLTEWVDAYDRMVATQKP
jgi:hypothetical protein